MKPVLCMEFILLTCKLACGVSCTSELKSFSESVFQANFSIPQLEKQLSIHIDVIHVELPDVKRGHKHSHNMHSDGSSCEPKYAF